MTRAPDITRRCYNCNQTNARYETHLDHDMTPIILLCENCAQQERDWKSVIWIRNLPPPKKAHP